MSNGATGAQVLVKKGVDAGRMMGMGKWKDRRGRERGDGREKGEKSSEKG